MNGLYESESLLQVSVLSGFVGGLAAWLAGRAIALTWRPVWYLVAYMILLGGALRFFHFALVGSSLLAISSYIVDTLYLIAVGSLAWRVTRTTQMVTQYDWLYERTSPVTWKSRNDDGQTGQKML